jgi:hypothetical protein
VASAAPSPWLSSRAFDLAVYATSPIWAAVGVLALAHVVEPLHMFYAFNIVFTIVHYGPTWLRVYCDREERARHRVSIYVFPAAVIAFAWLTYDRPEVLAFIIFIWDRWHAVMQNYGFLRLYDAKAGTSSRTRARRDLALLISSALLILSLNMGLFAPVLDALAAIGLAPVTSTTVVRGIQIGLAAATAVCAIAWLRDARRGDPAQPGRQHPRWIYLACVIGGHAMMNLTTNIFVLSSQEKVYHSLQYVALSWHYGKRRATAPATSQAAGRAFRAVFSATRWPVYAVAIAAWTAAAWLLNSRLGLHARGPGLFSLAISVMAPCHYYFDSFLWRVRRPEVRASL